MQLTVSRDAATPGEWGKLGCPTTDPPFLPPALPPRRAGKVQGAGERSRASAKVARACAPSKPSKRNAVWASANP